MDMKIDCKRIRLERERRAWSQEQLAQVTGLGLRTIQRIETTGLASYESVKAIASAFNLTPSQLRVAEEMQPAPEQDTADAPLSSAQRHGSTQHYRSRANVAVQVLPALV